ncbi:unnamed protein product, partial [Closterium sp. Naga37s-1]
HTRPQPPNIARLLSCPFPAVAKSCFTLQPLRQWLFALLSSCCKAVVAAVRAELAAHKEERDELQHEVNELRLKLTAVEEKNEATAVAVDESERELAAVKQEVAEQSQSTRLQLEDAERTRSAEMREMRGQVEERERELAAELAAVKGELAELKLSTALQLEEAERRRVAEMRGQVEERERELAAVKGELAEQKDALMELDVDLKISQSVGDQETAWQVSAEGIDA